MIYKKLCKDGPYISPLGFGSMRLPRDANGEIDRKKSIEIIHHCIQSGINIIDVAPGYSDKKSESIVGVALKCYAGTQRVYISGKGYPGYGYPSEFPKILDDSRRALGVDCIDFYHLWCIGLNCFERWIKQPDGPFTVIKWAKKYGMIKHFGFSSHEPPEKLKIMIDSGLFDFVLLQYNILDRRNEDIIAYAKKNGLGVMTMGSVVGGKLNGPIGYADELFVDKSINLNDTALRFVLTNPNVDVALSGMDTIQMIESNVKTASDGEELSNTEIVQIKQVSNKFKRLKDLYCTGCDYCKPCQKGINISAIFDIMNYHLVYGMDQVAMNSYKALLDGNYFTKSNSPLSCVECGICESRCPQNIPIIKQLKESHKYLTYYR